MTINTTEFVQWFRSAAPYIHAHRGKTFVLHFGGELIDCPVFPHLIHDIALLHSLGIRLVLVYGARPQIEQQLKEHKIKCRLVNDLRLTDAAALTIVKQVVGSLRIHIESLFSMGLPNSPMADAHVKVSSGNFVMAKPMGVICGTDLQFTGTVRRIDTGLIRNNLQNHEIVLIPPLGYSPTGEVFNLSSYEVATQTAISLQADKLLFLMSGNTFMDDEAGMIQHLTQAEAQALLSGRDVPDISPWPQLAAGLQASLKGVPRIHFIDQGRDGSLMQELFSRDGAGTMLSAGPYEDLRPATIEDIGGILELIRPLEEQGILVRRSREKMEREIPDYTVMVRDGAVIACAALHVYDDEHAAELACLAVHENYQKQAKGEQLLLKAEKDARKKGVSKLFVLTTHAMHWFLEQGFVETGVADLPVTRKQLYNYQRNSKILIKEIAAG
jgi:amino-acid N-acetyltransferase